MLTGLLPTTVQLLRIGAAIQGAAAQIPSHQHNYRALLDRITQELSALVLGAGFTERVRHRKRGEVARVLLRDVELQVSQVPAHLKEGALLTIYQAEETGKVWAREQCEFDDGRFEQLELFKPQEAHVQH